MISRNHILTLAVTVLALCVTTSCSISARRLCSSTREPRDDNNYRKDLAIYAPVSKVKGFLIWEGRRLDFVDGFVWMSCEPLEWGKYEIECRLAHDPFTRQQIEYILEGREVLLTHQSIPAGFPTSSILTSPYVSVMFGRWDTATLPDLSAMRIEIRTFMAKGNRRCHSHIELDKKTFKELHFDYNPLRVQFSTKGKKGAGKDLVEWDITFSSTCYDSTHLMYHKWKGY